MGFTPATIIAPSVPDGVDVITYLTSRDAETRIQEVAQEKARALAYGIMNKMPYEELEQLLFGSESRKLASKPLSLEEQQNIQQSKTTVIPSQIPRDASASTVGSDYPYLLSSSRTRGYYHYMSLERPPHQGTNRERSNSIFGKVKAPVFELSDDEVLLGPRILSKYADDLKKHGMIKLVMPCVWSPAALPFSEEHSVFQTVKQTLVESSAVSKRQVNGRNIECFEIDKMKRGFMRALLRYHMAKPAVEGRKLLRLPFFDKRPIDLYRMFHTVEQRGGLEAVIKRKEWAQVGRALGYSSISNPTLSSTIRTAYTKVVLPFKEWLDSQLMSLDVKRNCHILPRLDVCDDQKSTQNIKNWQELPYGIVIDVSEQVVDPSKRKFVTVSDSLNRPIHGTMKSQRGIETGAAAELETEYLNLPEYYETELTCPAVKLIPYPAEYDLLNDNNNLGGNTGNGSSATSTNTTFNNMSSNGFTAYTVGHTGETSKWNPWNFNNMSLRYHEFSSFISDDIDHLVIPELSIGHQFATKIHAPSPLGSYLVSTVVVGDGRTWYTKEGTWADQYYGEIIVLSPSTEATSWCHGYSGEVSTHVLALHNWLEHAMTNYDRVNKYVCIPQLVFNIASSEDKYLHDSIRNQALHVLKTLHHSEKALVEELQGKIPTIMKASDPLETAICSKSGEKLFFSWILLANGEIKSPGECRSGGSHSKAQFVTKYEVEDVNLYFNSLKEKLNSRTTPCSELWKREHTEALNNPNELPQEDKLFELMEHNPAGSEYEARSLSEVVVRSHEFLRQRRKSTKYVRDYLSLAECDNKEREIASELALIAESTKRFDENWAAFQSNLLAGKLFESDAAVTEICKDKSLLNDKQLSLLTRIEDIQKWHVEVLSILKSNIDSKAAPYKLADSKIRKLLTAGRALGISPESATMRRLQQEVSAVSYASLQVSKVVNSSVLSPDEIRKVCAEQPELNTFPPDLFESPSANASPIRQFYVLAAMLPLVERMYCVDLRLRPKKQEVGMLAAANIKAIRKSMEELENWLTEAMLLDWVTIATQIGRLSQRLPPDPSKMPSQPIRISRLSEVYEHLSLLKIVPDDIEAVVATFENAINGLRNMPPQYIQLYGFDQ